MTPTSAVPWARSDRGKVLFLLRQRTRFWGPRWFSAAASADPEIPAKVQFTGLTPDTSYSYYAFSRGRFSSGSFRTPALPGSHVGLRFGVSGDQRGDLAPFPAVTNAIGRGLDLFVFLGDTIYADIPSPDLLIPQATTLGEFRIKHQEVYSKRYGLNSLAQLRAAIPILTTIDDHEVTDDFPGGAHPSVDPRFPFTTESFINETPLFLNGMQTFHEYNPILQEYYGNTGDARTAGKTKLYRERRYGSDAALFLLDARSFRDAPLPPVVDITNSAEIGGFLFGSFDPSRTMLGAVQLADLESGLLQAELDGTTWKFVMVPEPIQNLGVIFAGDRFEGYAAERAELLSFIAAKNIHNVVFVAADLHGTLVNNLSYQTVPFGPQIAVDAFEIITGPVAFDAPLGTEVVGLAGLLGLLSPEEQAFYETLPMAGKDLFLETLINAQITPLGYDPLGLAGSSIDAELIQGGYTAAHVFGWTEFDIDAVTQDLTITTYGIEPYTEADLADPASVVGREPAIISRFVVHPK